MKETKSPVVKGPPGNWRSWVIWAAAALFYLYEYFVRVAPAVMLDEFQKDFGITAAALGAGMASYYYIYAPMQIMVGLLLDRFGGRMLLTWAAFAVAIGCLLPGLSDSFAMLIVGRILMGFGSAFAFVGAIYLATVWFPKNHLALLSGLTTALGMMGAIIGEAPLSKVVDLLGWQITFAVAGVFGFGVTAVIYFVIPKPPHWEQVRRQAYFKEDSPHSFLTGLKTVLCNGQTWIIGFIAFALFMPLSVFGDLWGVDYIQTVTGAKKNVAAGAVSMLYLGWLIGGPLWGMVSDSLECRRIPLLVALFMTALTSMVLLLFPHISMPYVYILLLCLGLASSVQVVCFIANIEVNPFFARGSALAVTNMIVMLIGGIFQWVVGLILNAIGHPEIDSGVRYLYTSTDYRVAMSVLPLMAIVALFVGFFMKESYTEHHSDLPPH